MSEEKSSAEALQDLFAAWLPTYLGMLVGKDLINYDLVRISLPHLDTGKSISGEVTPEQTAGEQISRIQELVSSYGKEARKQFSITLSDKHMTITRMG